MSMYMTNINLSKSTTAVRGAAGGDIVCCVTISGVCVRTQTELWLCVFVRILCAAACLRACPSLGCVMCAAAGTADNPNNPNKARLLAKRLHPSTARASGISAIPSFFRSHTHSLTLSHTQRARSERKGTRRTRERSAGPRPPSCCGCGPTPAHVTHITHTSRTSRTRHAHSHGSTPAPAQYAQQPARCLCLPGGDAEPFAKATVRKHYKVAAEPLFGVQRVTASCLMRSPT